ncbi:MAG TPA: hypothetical protein DD670_07435 [Planctomycetaceae bacterium]|nr:hypothetical protein [Planctomycetaceae bacterium]
MQSSTIPEGAELLTLREVALLCGVSDRKVWAWAETGLSPAPLKLSRGCVRYSETAYLQCDADEARQRLMDMGVKVDLCNPPKREGE